jgi:hypothetical protein
MLDLKTVIYQCKLHDFQIYASPAFACLPSCLRQTGRTAGRLDLELSELSTRLYEQILIIRQFAHHFLFYFFTVLISIYATR